MIAWNIGSGRTKCTENDSTDDRLAAIIREGVLFGNTNDSRIHAFTPAELILGYQPLPCHHDMAENPIPAAVDAAFVDAPAHQHGIYVAVRDEKRLLSSEDAAYSNYSKGKFNRKKQIPKPGDLVRVGHTIVFSLPTVLMVEKLALNMEQAKS